MAVTVKISQVSNEAISEQEAGQVKVSQNNSEIVSRQEAGRLQVSQAFAESVSRQEAGSVKASQVFVEVISSQKDQTLAHCPLFPGDRTYKPPVNTLAGNQVYTWRVRPLFSGTPGDFTGCCSFVTVSTGLKISQLSIEVIRQNI